MQKRWVKFAVAAAVLIVLIVVVVPLFVNADAFRPMIENQLSSALGRKVTLGHLSFSLWSGSLVAENVAVADDPAFSTTPFLQAKSLRIGVETGALLFHHQVNVQKFVADSPEIHLISGTNGMWNYASLGRGTTSTNAQPSNSTAVTVGKVQIENGSVVVSSVPATGKPFVYNDVNVTVDNLSLTQATPFEVTAKMPGGGSLALHGTAGPVNRQDTSATPLKASLTVKHFDPVAAGVVPASEGIGMVADIDAQVTSDGKTLTSTGKVDAQHLLLSRGGSPAPQPVNLDYNISENLAARTGQVTDIAVHTGSVAAHVTGTYQIAGQVVTLNLHLAAPNLPIDAVEQLLPAVGIRLPSGSSLKGGTLTANLAITGTSTAPDISGPVEIDNTQLAGFDLGSKIQGLKGLTGTGGVTQIKTVRANVRSTVPSTQLTNIYADVPALGTATGNGTVSAAGNLNFQLVAKLSSSSGVGAMANAATTAAGGVLGSLLHSAVSNGVPLTITGTTSNPSIMANVGAMLKGQTGQQQKGAAGLLNGLFKK